MAAYTTIDDPEAYFQVKTYTGNNSTNAQTLDGDTDMEPGMIWFKRRDSAANHSVFDAVRGVTKRLATNTTGNDTTVSDALTSFNSDGFTLGNDASNYINYNTATYVAWCWKAGTTSGLSGGSITPDAYSFNATSGTSIVKFEGNGSVGATVVHGLGAVPKMIIIKGTDLYVNNWQVYHVGGGNTGNYVLNGTDAFADDDSRWNDTTPTSTVWTMGSGATVNYNGRTFVAYLFSDIQGFSKFGTYVGNGNADGAFVYTGFRPAFVLNKRSSSTANWVIHDNKRTTFNVCNAYLKPNTTAADTDDSGRYVDLLSNGFKWRGTDTETNHSGSTYIYAAFAEAPFVNSEGVPCNAR